MHKNRHNYLTIAIIAILGVITESTVRVQLFGNRSLVLFYMEIYVGNPPVLQRIHVDTGSPLTTIKCSDCKVCIDKKVTNYNELTSFTSKKLTCDSRLPICDESCKMSQNDGYCHFFISYGDGTTVIGNIIQDQIRFSPNDEPFNAQFGCMKFQREYYQANLDGLLGLSPNFKQNILNKWFEQQQEQNQFSICLGENGGYIDIGPDQQFYNYQVVFKYETTQQIFSVNDFESISFGQRQIISSSYGLEIVLFDTGSTYSHLPTPAYSIIAQTIWGICQNYNKGCIKAKDRLCVSMMLSSTQHNQILQELSTIFPKFQIKINDHILTWQLSQYIYIIQTTQKVLEGSTTICFAIGQQKNLRDKTVILGMYWMIGKRFKFNLKEQTISILTKQQCKYNKLQVLQQGSLQRQFNSFITFVTEYILAIVLVIIFLAVIFKKTMMKFGERLLICLRRIPPFAIRLWRFLRRPRPQKQKKPNNESKARRRSGNKKKPKSVSPQKAIQLSAQSQQIQTSTIQQT